MSRRAALVQLLVVVVVAVAVPTARHARAQHDPAAPTTTTGSATTTGPATTTTSPTTVPEEIVENPFYVAWAGYTPGTMIEFELKTDAAGQQMTTHITQRLVEASAEKVVVDVEARIEVPGIPNPPQPQKQTKTFLPRVPKSEAERGLRPPGAGGDPVDAGTETVHAAGREFATTVTEYPGRNGTEDGKARAWRAPQIPGGLVKLESSTSVMKVELIVTKVQEK